MGKPKILEIQGTVLYESDSGTNETITLSESVENYRKIGIVYKDTRLSIENYVEVIEAHGKKVNLLSLQSLSYYYLTASIINIQENTITWELNDRIRISDGQNPADFWHVITKVVGYK